MSRSRPLANFYRSSEYCAEESVAAVMKRTLGSMANQADVLLGPHSLTSAQAAPLMRLKTVGLATVAEVARWLHADAGATTRLLDRLERKGFCRRVRSGSDRRVVMVGLTPLGEEAIADAPIVFCQVMNDHLAGFSNSEWNALKDYLLRMLKNAEALRDAGPASAGGR